MRLLLERFHRLGLDAQITWLLVILAATLPALDVGLSLMPALKARMPHFMESELWRAAPLIMLVTAAVLYMRKNRRTPLPEAKHGSSKLVLPQPRFEPDYEFKFLPIDYKVDLSAPLPFVECRFYVVNFHTKKLTIADFKLSLGIYGAPTLENIPLRNHEVRIEAKSAQMVTCRRNLTDAECKVIPQKSTTESQAFEMFVRAADNDNRTFTYGPVSSMVIDGAVKIGFRMPREEPIDRSVFASLQSAASRVYDELKDPSHVWRILAESTALGDSDAILNQMAAFIAGEIPIYGKQPPGTKIVRLEIREKTQISFDGGATKMRFMGTQLPECTDLYVKRDDLASLIARERGKFTPSRGG